MRMRKHGSTEPFHICRTRYILRPQYFAIWQRRFIRRGAFRCGSRTDINPCRCVDRFALESGNHRRVSQGPLCADIVAKVFLGWRTKILRAADAPFARRREGPHRFIQNRSWTSLVVLKSDAAAEKPKDQLSRDL